MTEGRCLAETEELFSAGPPLVESLIPLQARIQELEAKLEWSERCLASAKDVIRDLNTQLAARIKAGF